MAITSWESATAYDRLTADVVPFPRASGTATPREQMVRVVRGIAAGNGRFRFALLRESPLDEGLIDNGDADLLGTRESVVELLRELLARAVAGDVHFRVTANKPEKLQLTVYSIDFAHSATYDLWMDLPQIHGGRARLRFEDLAPLLSRPLLDGPAASAWPLTEEETWRGLPPSSAAERGITSLPGCVGGAIYLQHLVAKRKPLTAGHTVERMRSFGAHVCDDSTCGVARWFTALASSGAVSAGWMNESAAQIERLLKIRLDDAVHRVASTWRPRRRIEANDAVCLLGVDGVGKSTLVETLVRDGLVAAEALTGKKLYRRSFIYQLTTRAARRRDASGREAIDERLAPLLYVRAVSAFRRTLAWRRLMGRGTLLVDRCPLDFLYRGRKTDCGAFHPSVDRLESLAPATPTIQLVAPHAVTSARKAELTEAGHAAYDDAMLLRIAGRSPCDHLVFHNGGSAVTSVSALTRYLGAVLKTCGARRAA